ncbi:hypothetical protein [Phytohabitans flavus]
MSFEMACRILGATDDGWSSRLNRLLGVAVLASGGIDVVTPAAAVGAAWGWIDQKNELVGHINIAVRKVRDRGLGCTGRERHELIAAAHTAGPPARVPAAHQPLRPRITRYPCIRRSLRCDARRRDRLARVDWRCVQGRASPRGDSSARGRRALLRRGPGDVRRGPGHVSAARGNAAACHSVPTRHRRTVRT